jgi:hypothetical protein
MEDRKIDVVRDNYLNEMAELEGELYQKWVGESYGIMNLCYSPEESTFDLYQDGKVYFGCQKTGSKVVLVSDEEMDLPNIGKGNRFIGCAWYGPNMRVAKFSKPIDSKELAFELAERILN